MKNYRFKVKKNRLGIVLNMRVMFKKCPKCGEILFRECFNKDKKRSTGLCSTCKECVKHNFVCQECGKKFKSKNNNAKFCSKECSGVWNSKNKIGENSANWKGGNIKCNCDYCGKEIEVNKYRYNNTKNHYCSYECANKHRSVIYIGENSPSWKGGSITFNCDYCGKECSDKVSHYSKSKNHFCSQDCKNKWQSENRTGENSSNWQGGKITVSCSYCGKEIEVNKYEYNNYKNHFCSQECKAKWQSENVKGENHPNYDPTKTQEEREQERKYPEYNDWRKEVYKRDNYTCQCCGVVGNGHNLNAHHIYGYTEYKDLGTDINNGVTLCEDCHKRYHKQYGYKNNNYKDFRTFLYNEMMKQNTLEARLFYINTIEDITLRLEIRGLLGLESA